MTDEHTDEGAAEGGAEEEILEGAAAAVQGIDKLASGMRSGDLREARGG